MRDIKKFEVITNSTTGKTIYVKSDYETEYYQYDSNTNLSCKTLIKYVSPTMTYLDRYVVDPDTKEVISYHSSNGCQQEEKCNKLISRYSSQYEVYKIYKDSAERTIFYDVAHTDTAIDIYKHKGNDFIEITVYFTNPTSRRNIIATFINPIDEKDVLSNTIPEIEEIDIGKSFLKNIRICDKKYGDNIEREYYASQVCDIPLSKYIVSIKYAKECIELTSGGRLVFFDIDLVTKLKINFVTVTPQNGDGYEHSTIWYHPNGKISKLVKCERIAKENYPGYTKSYYAETTTHIDENGNSFTKEK